VRRFVPVDLAQAYDYIHFLDSDTGPSGDPATFYQRYRAHLDTYRPLIAQPANVDTNGGGGSAHKIVHKHERCAVRWTGFVEIGECPTQACRFSVVLYIFLFHQIATISMND
jgi:hypothetical protein